MIYFILPRTYIFTYKHIGCYEYENKYIIDKNNDKQICISNSLSFYLCDIKEKIDDYEKEWDIYKKYTNPFEYIHSIVPNTKKSVSKYKPLSRSYFKMIELVNLFNLKDFQNNQNECYYINQLQNRNNKKNNKKNNTPIKTFHLAEGPGGFIEAIVNLRENPCDIYIGMTILDDNNDMNVPSWKKSINFLKDNVNVFIENCIDQTGNILNIDNFVYCKNKYGSSIDLITADGGFDFSVDFNNQENTVSRLLFAQVAFALCMQKKNGHFILKIFDTFMMHTIDILYILSSFYEKVYITKPQTSRFANSEKYIVCKNFIYSSNDFFFPFLYKTFVLMLNIPQNSVFRFLNISISNIFLTKLEEYNSIFGQQQIENIHQTISLIECYGNERNEKIENLIKTNIQKSINWCLKYNIPFNNFH